jgi:hypothetical protein
MRRASTDLACRVKTNANHSSHPHSRFEVPAASLDPTLPVSSATRSSNIPSALPSHHIRPLCFALAECSAGLFYFFCAASPPAGPAAEAREGRRRLQAVLDHMEREHPFGK